MLFINFNFFLMFFFNGELTGGNCYVYYNTLAGVAQKETKSSRIHSKLIKLYVIIKKKPKLSLICGLQHCPLKYNLC